MTPLDTFHLVGALFGLAALVADKGKDFLKKIEDKKKKNLRAQWRRGLSDISKNRECLTRALCSFYASTERPQEVREVVYQLGKDDFRVLPLATREDCLYVSRPEGEETKTEILCSYEGETVEVPPLLKRDGEDLMAISDEDRIADLEEKMSDWVALEFNFWDAPLYSLRDINEKNELILGMTSFLTYRSTYGYLVDELALHVGEHALKQDRFNNLAKDFIPLPNRRLLLPSLGGLFNFKGRTVAGGPAVLFAAETGEGDIALLVQKRSHAVSDEVGALTVLPKAFHQPMVSPMREAQLSSTIFRECYEEILGMDQSLDKSKSKPIDPKHYLAESEAMRELVASGTAQLIPLGLLWDLTRGNYHPCYCLYVEDHTWWTKYRSQVRLTWEVDKDIEPEVRTSDSKAIVRLVENANWAPESYFTFVEGLRWLARGRKDGFSKEDWSAHLPKLITEEFGSYSTRWGIPRPKPF